MSHLLLASVWTASLLGSLHCVGMCGPFIGAYAGACSTHERTDGGRATHERANGGHVAYHAGRLCVYVSLGALAGGLGAAVNFAFDSRGWIEMAALVTSCVLIGSGLLALLPRKLRAQRPRGKWSFGPRRVLLQLGRAPRAVRGGALGLFTPLLPCGWLYAFVLVAAGAGSVAAGMATMVAFWAGTVPALLGLGVVIGKLSARLRTRLPTIMGAMWIVIGLLGLVSRTNSRVVLQDTFQPDAAPTVVSKPRCH